MELTVIVCLENAAKYGWKIEDSEENKPEFTWKVLQDLLQEHVKEINAANSKELTDNKVTPH